MEEEDIGIRGKTYLSTSFAICDCVGCLRGCTAGEESVGHNVRAEGFYHEVMVVQGGYDC